MQQPVKRERKTERNLAILKMRSDGKRLEEIAQYFGVTRQRVYQLLKGTEVEKNAVKGVFNKAGKPGHPQPMTHPWKKWRPRTKS